MRIEARRVSEAEYDQYLSDSGVEFIDGRLLTGPGLELFVGVTQFEEFCRRVDNGEDGFIDDEHA